MLENIRRWYNGVVARAIAKQERKLAEELEETKRLPKTPERDRLIAETEAFLLEGKGDLDSVLGAKITATEADLKQLRTEIAKDTAKAERSRLAARVDRLADLSKKI